METIAFAEFEKSEIRVGTILKAVAFPEARKPAYKLTIDFGRYGIKQSSAQITQKYTIESLTNRQVLAVVNFAPKNIAGFLSECLVLGATNEAGEVILIEPSEKVENGSRIS